MENTLLITLKEEYIMRDTDIIFSKLYSFVSKALDKNSKKFLGNVHQFINDRHEQLFSIAPYENIYYNRTDLEKFYVSLGFTEQDVVDICKDIWFWDQPVNPGCVKEPSILVLLCAIRYYLKNYETKNAEITAIYMAFNGKIYASLFGLWFPKAAPGASQKGRSCMEYVVNNMLSDKFDIKKEGSVFGAIQKLCQTWINSYSNKITRNSSDDDCKLIIQQLRDRVKSFIGNIADLYYKAYKDNAYMNYETDDLGDENFRLTDNDAALAAKLTQATMNILTSQKVDLRICELCRNENIKTSSEIKDIIESILADNNNLPDVKKVVNIIICDFMENNKNSRVGSAKFVDYTLKAKPNTKSKMILEMKATILRWLDENSPNYRKRKTRAATANNYFKSILGYFTWTICKVSN